jgi:hypothetical protein
MPPTTWSKAKNIHGGLLSVLNVLIAACVDAKSRGGFCIPDYEKNIFDHFSLLGGSIQALR